MNKNEQSGYVVVLVMIMVLITLTMMLGLTFSTISENHKYSSVYYQDRLQAYYVAEAGIEMGLSWLKEEISQGRGDDVIFLKEHFTSQFAQEKEFAHGFIKNTQINYLTPVTKQLGEKKVLEVMNVEISTQGYFRQGKKTLIVQAQIYPVGTIKILSWKNKFSPF